MNRLTKRIIVLLSMLVLGYVAAGYMLAKTTDDKTYRVLTVFSEVLGHIQHDYVEEPNMRHVTAGALHGLLDALDPESSYLSPLEYTDYEKATEANPKAEAGVVLSRRFGYIAVVSVLPDSPGMKAGLHDGDILESLGGFATDMMATGQARLLLKGAPGTVVKMSVVRRDKPQPQDMEVILAKLAPSHLLDERMQGDVAYLRVPAFDEGMNKQVRDKLMQMEQKGAHKLVLDLRDCAEGPISEAVATAQLFLPSGTIVTLKGQTVSAQTFSADPAKVVWKEPMTVLISSGTAGAAEVLAAAIADNHRGETVGLHTFGTASVQKVITLDDGAALILTVTNYYTPGGKMILNEGIEPADLVQTPLEDTSDLGADENTITRPGQIPGPDDPVLKKALDILQHPPAAHKAVAAAAGAYSKVARADLQILFAEAA
jgi:carboxyl-terminal processing protease